MKTLKTIHLNSALFSVAIAALMPCVTQAQVNDAAQVDRAKAAMTTNSPSGHPEGVPVPAGHASLAHAAQNPLAAMISVPMQNNFNFGVGPTDGLQYQTLWEPVMPMKLNKDWNMINRAIIPVPMYQPRVSGSQGSTWGIGDINYEAFISPAKPGKLIWGVGPLFGFPSASSDILGSGKWTVGPTVVALTMHGPWVVGSLVSQSWSFAGDSDRAGVSLGSWQYFLNYNIPKSKGWYLSSSPTMTANWNAPGRNQFTVPVGAGVGKIFKIGKQPMNAKIQAFGFPVRPEGGPEWGLEFQLTFLFPK